MASILKKLSDEDLLALHHMIRRDDTADAKIWAWAAPRLGKGDLRGELAGAMVVARYRKSPDFTKWLSRWQNQDQDLKKAVALQAQRFQLLSSLVSDPDSKGIEALSKSLQARLLTLAAEASDEELVEGSGKNGWIKNVIRVIQEESKLQRNTMAETLKAGLSDMGEKVDTKVVIEKVDEIMGLKK
jgi:hypothetical protein